MDPKPTKICSIDGCESPARSRGWCEMHYMRWWRYSDPHIVLRTSYSHLPAEERFWKKVNVRGPDDCWEWQAYRDRDGYGTLTLNWDKILAHRAAWIFTHGDIPEGMHVCHMCDVPSCVNPDHLFLGTQSDNIRDMIRKGRGRWSNRSDGALEGSDDDRDE